MRKLARLMVWLVMMSGSSGQVAADEATLTLNQAGMTRHFATSELNPAAIVDPVPRTAEQADRPRVQLAGRLPGWGIRDSPRFTLDE